METKYICDGATFLDKVNVVLCGWEKFASESSDDLLGASALAGSLYRCVKCAIYHKMYKTNSNQCHTLNHLADIVGVT